MEENHSWSEEFLASCWTGTGVSEGLFGLILIRAPPGVTATCDITLSACLTRLQTLRDIYQRWLSGVRVSDEVNCGLFSIVEIRCITP